MYLSVCPLGLSLALVPARKCEKLPEQCQKNTHFVHQIKFRGEDRNRERKTEREKGR
jgi:hypothetical protein